MNPIIHARNLSKQYGATKALDAVSFDIEAGRIVGLIGPNGAGKTTALKAILGLTDFTGELSVLGFDPRKQRTELMEQVCFIADVAVLPRWIRVREAVEFVAGVHPRFSREKCQAFLARTKIEPGMRVRELSKGMIVQLHLALVMAIDAKLLVLDEPTLGLDILYRKSFYESLLADYFDENKTIIVTTHQIEEVEHILTDLMFIQRRQDRARGDDGRGRRPLRRGHGQPGPGRRGACAEAAQRTPDLRQIDLPVRRRRPLAPRRTRRTAQTERRRPVRRHHERDLRMNTLPLLLKREYWEHRGGFLWTPAWITGVILIITVFGMISAEVFSHHVQVRAAGISFDQLRNSISAEDFAQAGNGLDMVQLTLAGIASIGLFFVSFFYLLGALYDDRRDRSVLFWKSLPVSDTATVASKALTAMLVMPAIVLVVATLAYVLFLVLVSIWVAAHGMNPLPAIAGAHPFGMFLRLLLILPVGALWALPTVGWLLFWSAFARSKPFMWAVLLPVLALFANWWVGLLGGPHISGDEHLATMLGRLLFSVMPGSWMGQVGSVATGNNFNGNSVVGNLDPSHVYPALATPNLWIGVIVGLALVAGAIWLRSRRIETNA